MLPLVPVSLNRLQSSSYPLLHLFWPLNELSRWAFEMSFRVLGSSAFAFPAPTRLLFIAPFFCSRKCSFTMVSGDIQSLWCIFYFLNVFQGRQSTFSLPAAIKSSGLDHSPLVDLAVVGIYQIPIIIGTSLTHL
mgnify:CR=1 FL=1